MRNSTCLYGLNVFLTLAQFSLKFPIHIFPLEKTYNSSIQHSAQGGRCREKTGVEIALSRALCACLGGHFCPVGTVDANCLHASSNEVSTVNACSYCIFFKKHIKVWNFICNCRLCKSFVVNGLYLSIFLFSIFR